MPEPYVNPVDFLPFNGYRWVPNVTPNGKTVFGFNSLTLERGSFRNDLPQGIKDTATGNIITNCITVESSLTDNSDKTPFCNTYRTEEYYSLKPELVATPCVLSGSDFYYRIKNLSNGFSNLSRISTILIEYSLTVNPIVDSEVIGLLEDEDKAQIVNYVKDTNNIPDIDWNKYTWGRVKVTFTNGTSSYGDLISGNTYEFPKDKEELKLTGLNTSNLKRTVEIRLSDAKVESGFLNVEQIEIINRHELISLQLKIYNIWLYDAKRVNIPNNNLPCKILSYAYPVQFNYDPNFPSIFPRQDITPTFSVKVFNPLEKVAVTGFAHSLDLRFLIVSVPVYGLSGFAFTIGGLLTDITSNRNYLTTFAGVMPSKQNVLLSTFGGGKLPSQYCFFFGEKLPKNIKSIIIQKKIGDLWQDNANYAENNIQLFPKKYLMLTPKDSTYRAKYILTSGNFVYSAESKSIPYYESISYNFDACTPIKIIRACSKVTTLNELNNTAPILKYYGELKRTDFVNGEWKVKFSGKSEKNNAHVCFRFYIVGENKQKNINKEILFENNGLTVGRCTSLKQLLTARLDNGSYDLIKNINNINKIYTYTSGHVDDLLMCEVILFSDIDNEVAELDLTQGKIETVIYQVFSNELYCRRYARNKNATLTNIAPMSVYQDTVELEGFEYKYDKQIDFTKVNKINNLGKIKDINLPTSFVIPYDKEYVDFYFDKEISKSIIDSGEWDVDTSFNYNTLDNKYLIYDYKIKFFVFSNNNSDITWIYESEKLIGAKKDGNISNIKFNITYPFVVDNNQSYLGVRIYIYPKVLVEKDRAEIQIELGTLPLGARINFLTINKNTIYLLKESSTGGSDNSPGNKGFEEKLPVVPEKALNSQQFWYVASEEDIKVLLTLSGENRTFSGTLFSPTWFVQLPQNMEVALFTNFIQRTLFFRTVLDSVTNNQSLQQIAVAENKLTHNLSIVYNTDKTILKYFNTPFNKSVKKEETDLTENLNISCQNGKIGMKQNRLFKGFNTSFEYNANRMTWNQKYDLKGYENIHLINSNIEKDMYFLATKNSKLYLLRNKLAALYIADSDNYCGYLNNKSQFIIYYVTNGTLNKVIVNKYNGLGNVVSESLHGLDFQGLNCGYNSNLDICYLSVWVNDRIFIRREGTDFYFLIAGNSDMSTGYSENFKKLSIVDRRLKKDEGDIPLQKAGIVFFDNKQLQGSIGVYYKNPNNEVSRRIFSATGVSFPTKVE